eukprot:4615375-Alexandrium_andersonii.AAC.1
MHVGPLLEPRGPTGHSQKSRRSAQDPPQDHSATPEAFEDPPGLPRTSAGSATLRTRDELPSSTDRASAWTVAHDWPGESFRDHVIPHPRR